MKLVKIGNGHSVVVSRIISVVKYGSRPTKRLKAEFEKRNAAIDVSAGDGVKTLVLVDDGYLFLSSVSPETMTKRIEEENSVD
jgi:regulator of extracellular matrix RemA (YlzA/DUF370 family)